jgi:hypothetical protein
MECIWGQTPIHQRRALPQRGWGGAWGTRAASLATARAHRTTALATGARICPGRRMKKRKTPKRTARRSEDRQLASRAQNAMNATVCRCADTSHKAEYGQLSEWPVTR